MTGAGARPAAAQQVERPVEAGVRVHQGRGDRPRTAAALYGPHPARAGPGGRLRPAAVWALLDCPTAWVAHRPGALAMLGRLTGEIRGTVDGRWPCAATWIRVAGTP